MPKGVEHMRLVHDQQRAAVVQLSVMPKGVEHVPPAYAEAIGRAACNYQ